MEHGRLNKKSEFKSNEICRLVSRLDSWEEEKEFISKQGERRDFNLKMENFIKVMKSVVKKFNDLKNENPNLDSDVNFLNTAAMSDLTAE